MLKHLLAFAIGGFVALGASAQEAYERPQAQLAPDTPHAGILVSSTKAVEPIEDGATFKSSVVPMLFEKDYSLSMTVPSCANGNKIPMSFSIGKDVKAVRYLCIQGDYASSEANYDLVAQYGDELDPENDDLGSKAITIDKIMELTTERSSRYTILVVAMDKAEKGTRQAQLKAYFYSINDDDDNWKTLGSTYYVEDIVSNMYSAIYSTSTYVSIQEHKSTPGYYRIVNPYGSGWSYKYKNKYSHTHKHYIYIHAEDPNKVYLDESPICTDLGHGGISIASMATPGFTTGSLTSYYGKMVDHVITFPAKALLISMQDYNDGKWFRANTNAKFRVTVPPSPQTITWDQTFPVVYAGDVIDLTATASSGLEVTYTLASSASGLASIEGNRLTLLAPGTITISAWQQGDNKVWAAAPTITRQIVCYSPDSQSITWNQTFNTAMVGDEITLTATATSGLDVTYSLDEASSLIASLEGNILTFLAPGVVNVTASQGGNGKWDAAEDVTRQIECSAYDRHALFVYGPFSDWKADERYMFTSDNGFLYTAELPAKSLTDNGEPVEWFIANANGTIRFGTGTEVELGGKRIAFGGGNNTSNIESAVTIIIFLDDECWAEGAFVDMTLLANDSLEGIVPETLGVVGQVENAEWSLERFPMLHKEGNVFIGTVTMTGPLFILCEHGMTDPDDWTSLGTFYGPEEENTMIPLSKATTFVAGNSEQPFEISHPEAVYPMSVNFSVDFDANKVTVALGPGTTVIPVTIEEGAETEPVYYNLQGIRVENPSGGLYIVARGAVVTKEIRQ